MTKLQLSKILKGAVIGTVGLILLFMLISIGQGVLADKPADPGPAPKFFVCKYVGTPGEDERLQTGQNPISVSGNALPDGTQVGDSFADAQGRSFVVAEDTGQEEPECPPPENEEPEVPVDVCVNLDGLQLDVPDGYVLKGDTCHKVVIINDPKENETPAPDGSPATKTVNRDK